MKKKIITYLLVTMLAVLTVIGIFSEIKKGKTKEPDGGSVEQYQESAPSDPLEVLFSNQDKVTVSGVEVINFTKGAETMSEKKIVVVEHKENHDVIYHTDSKLFLISILASPFTEQRMLSEIDFINKLGIEREEACGLNVVVTTPSFVNKEEAGRNYKLSFCE